MSEIKIFMCCHKGFEIVPPLCGPIQCGSAINPKIDNVLYDDSGENISLKNREYCELTAHYFAWKNIVADYYGFCHYRRFLCLKEGKRPYYAKGKLSENDKKNFFENEQHWRKLAECYEIIAPQRENMGITTREYYCNSKFHYTEDLNLFVEILNKKYPQFECITEQYLSQNIQYFCNMFIMDKAHFFEYCEVLFDVLNEFDSRKKLHGEFQSDRTDGYLGEIFTGIYITYSRENGAKIKELPRLDTNCSVKKRIGCALLPPESKRRFLAKKIAKNRRKMKCMII